MKTNRILRAIMSVKPIQLLLNINPMKGVLSCSTI
jgi:hypothetical protein